ncbi:helix-turn-helix domain-containing protein [Sulfurimonas sp.]
MEKNIELKKLADRIKRVRAEKGLSQEELAYLSSFDRTYISLLERAKRNPSFYNLLKLSKGLDIPLSDLLKGL